MCGIFVAFNPTGIKHLNQETLKQSTYMVQHRGPDNTGFFVDAKCFLGHTRLSIVGIDQSANQPFRYGKYVMTYNGEVFNYVELREDLTKFGYTFSTTSDTEVVLKSFDYWGSACFERFNGMWALAIYDTEKHRLIVSRDRFGQKPLFVARVDGTYFFASEAQQLVDYTKYEINFGLIQLFLKEGSYEGNGQTFFSEIQEFPKAHYFEIPDGPDGKSTRYWDYPSGEVIDTTESSHTQFEHILKDAVSIRMRTDVPFGLMLSGGVDSTIIAAIVRDLSGVEGKVSAFTYATRDKDDESKYAAIVAERLSFDLTLQEQTSNPVDYIERLKELVKRLGRGHSSPAIMSIDYLYEGLAKSGVKVALDGQGADELLAGYKQFYPEIIVSQVLHGRFKQAFINLKTFLSQGSQFEYGAFSVILIHFRTNGSALIRKLMRKIYGYEQLFSHYKQKVNTSIVPIFKSSARNLNAVNRHLQKQHTLGLENLLFYGDIVSMKNSVENRSPFMDHRLVEFCFRHDELLKVFDGQEKYVLRGLRYYQAFRDILERDKIGFSSDIKRSTKQYMCNLLQKSHTLEWPIFSGKIYDFVCSEQALSPKYERFLFRLFQVHLWCEIFLQCGKGQKNYS